MKKRFLSILMALCLALSLLPVSALAEEGETEVIPVPTNGEMPTSQAVSLPGVGSGYTVSGNTITLNEDVTLTQQWTIGQDETVILNLNGNDLSVQQAILVEGELTVEDSTASTGPEVKSDYSVDYTSGTIKNSGTTVLVQNGGSLIVNSGTIQSSSNIAVAVYGSTTMENWDTPVYSQATIAGGYLLSREFGAAVYGNGAELDITGGVIVGQDNAAVAGNGSYNQDSDRDGILDNYGGTTINISGGTLIGHIITSGYIAIGIYHPQSGVLNITGGTIYADNGVGICMRNGTLNVSGDAKIIATGTESGKVGDAANQIPGKALVVDYASGYNHNNSETDTRNVVITGGEFSAEQEAVEVYKTDGNKVVTGFITGGTFKIGSTADTSVQTYFPKNSSLTVNNDGQVITDTTTAVAEVGDVPYKTLQDAIEAAQSGDTIVLQKSVETSTIIRLPTNVTLNGGGHSITYAGETPAANPKVLIVMESGADNVTIENVTLNTSGKLNHGVEFFAADNGKLSGVTINGGSYTAVQVNGSKGITIENCILNPDADAYTNIEYCLSNNAQSSGGTTPSMTIENVTFDTSTRQIWADKDTIDNVNEETDGEQTDAEVMALINSSITNKNSGSVTVNFGLTSGGETSSTIPGTAPVTPSNPGSGSSSSSSTTYSPTLDVSDGGTIKVSPRTPEAGDKVTITPDPDSGYEVGEVTVTDRSGDAMRVTTNRDGTYTFTQPRGRVTIEVTFVRAGESVFFDDVPASFWAYDEIAWAYDNGYVNGTSAATFSPNSSITRQQVWMILARLSGADPASMAAAREWAMVNDISDGTNPGNAVTRQQLVALLYRYAQMMGYDNGAREALTSFPDAGTVSGYAQEPMQWSVANGIVAGTSAGTLNPAGTATRAQFAVILYRFWDQVG